MSEPLAIPDVNVLVALTNASHVHHGEAHRWLAGVDTFATTPVTEAGLLRMLLNQAVTGRVVAPAVALQVLRGVRADHRARFIADDSSLADAAVDLAGLGGHKQVTDWHLVNLAARNDGVLVTFDRRLAGSLLPSDSVRVYALG